MSFLFRNSNNNDKVKENFYLLDLYVENEKLKLQDNDTYKKLKEDKNLLKNDVIKIMKKNEYLQVNYYDDNNVYKTVYFHKAEKTNNLNITMTLIHEAITNVMNQNNVLIKKNFDQFIKVLIKLIVDYIKANRKISLSDNQRQITGSPYRLSILQRRPKNINIPILNNQKEAETIFDYIQILDKINRVETSYNNTKRNLLEFKKDNQDDLVQKIINDNMKKLDNQKTLEVAARITGLYDTGISDEQLTMLRNNKQQIIDKFTKDEFLKGSKQRQKLYDLITTSPYSETILKPESVSSRLPDKKIEIDLKKQISITYPVLKESLIEVLKKLSDEIKLEMSSMKGFIQYYLNEEFRYEFLRELSDTLISKKNYNLKLKIIK